MALQVIKARSYPLGFHKCNLVIIRAKGGWALGENERIGRKVVLYLCYWSWVK